MLLVRTNFGTSGPPGAAPNTQIRPITGPVANLDVVHLDGAGNAAQADASTMATSNVIGVMQAVDTPSAGQGTLVYSGELSGFAGLNPGEDYLLSLAAGSIVAVSDTANPNYPDANNEVRIRVGRAVNATTLFVDIGVALELTIP